MGIQLAFICAVAVLQFPSMVQAHGRLMNPPSRMSAWRVGFNTPVEYTDNQQNCGGFSNQWNVYNGKCGLCGDPFQGPRRYERPNGEKVPSLVITATYTQGDMMNLTLYITASHKGWHEFRICDTRLTNGIEATQQCLNQNLLADRSGQTRFPQGAGPGEFSTQLVLPPGLTCPQCVVQWKWHCGNNVGYGEKQEEFYGCSDITVNARSGVTYTPPTQPMTTPRRTTPRRGPPTRWPPITRPTTPKPTRGPIQPWNDPRLPLGERLKNYRIHFYKNLSLIKKWSRTHIGIGPNNNNNNNYNRMSMEKMRNMLNRNLDG